MQEADSKNMGKGQEFDNGSQKPEAVLNTIFFKKKFSLFLVFFVLLVLSLALELRFVGQNSEVPKDTFVFSELEGDVELRRAEAGGEKKGVLENIVEGVVDLKNGDVLMTKADSHVVIEINENGYIAMGPNSVLKFDNIKLNGEGQVETLKEAQLYLESGRLWINNLFNTVTYNLYTDKVLLVPGNAVFEIAYNGAKLNVYNHQHDLNVGLLAKPYSELSEAGKDGLFYNYFFLPEGNSIEIAESKISEKLATLLLSKLVKEFPIRLVLTEELEKDSWYETNMKRDLEVLNSQLMTYADSLGDTMLFRKFNNLQELYFSHFERNKFPLVLSDDKSIASKEVFLMKIFSVGQKWSFLEDIKASSHNSKQFYSLWQSSLNYLNFDARNYLAAELDALEGVLHTNTLYSGKRHLWDANFAELRDKKDHKALVDLLASNLEEIYDLIDQTDNARALESFTEWSARLNLLMGSYNKDDLKPFYADIETLRHMVTNLFFRYSDFYVEEHFDVLTYVDQKLIELAPDRLEEEENRQTMIQDRIKILKKLSYLIQEDKIDKAVSLELGRSMLTSVKNLRNQALYRVAIYNYFDSEIAEQELLFEFYASPEYVLLKGSFEEAFAEFQGRRQDWQALQDYLKKVQPGKRKVKRVDTDLLIAEVYEQFVDRDIFPDSIGVLGDEQNRLFEIKDGKIGQHDFSGMFDNETKLIYDVKVGEKLLGKGVHIDKLREVVNSIVLVEKGEGDEVEEVFGEEFSDNVKYSSAEDLALTLTVNELNSSGFFVAKADVEILDLLKNRFYVKNVSLDEFSYSLSFEFDNTSDTLSKVRIEVVKEDTEAGQGTTTETIYLEDEVSLDKNISEILNTSLEELMPAEELFKSTENTPGKVQRKKVKR
jgi:hypothetical protein